MWAMLNHTSLFIKDGGVFPGMLSLHLIGCGIKLTGKLHNGTMGSIMLPIQIEEFITSKQYSTWLAVGPLMLYVRKSIRQNQKEHGLIRCFDIANVQCHDKGVGYFSEFFANLEELSEFGFNAIYIEQVLNSRFAEYFRKKQLLEVKDLADTPSFFHFLGA